MKLDGSEGVEVVRRGEVVEVELWYPRLEGDRVRCVEVGLTDVRAADPIRIEYDFERDGWVIKRWVPPVPLDYDDEAKWEEDAFVGKVSR